LAQREEMKLFRLCDKRFAYRRCKFTLRKRAVAVSASREASCFRLNFSGTFTTYFPRAASPSCSVGLVTTAFLFISLYHQILLSEFLLLQNRYICFR